MKAVFLSATALIAAATYSKAADCDMNKIESLLYPNATQGLASCANATGIDIFAVNQFPTSDQVELLSENVVCANYYNQINQVANAEIQCNVTIEGVPVIFGGLIADFLMGKTGNETDENSGSIEFQSESASQYSDPTNQDSSAVDSDSRSNTPDDTTDSSGSSRTQLFSFFACGLATVMMIAYQ
ncbi:elicitin-like protein [Plasmopara halstedii]|uniref:Elicitin n=1 Tax=Plasmopara halstedii TaxID=4781 RepID=A0A0P1ASS5_PLAHL|nr:elicitin-like protein [Plasmopara halstedii]CEG44318.1 elicitin-like protein [Plasmopara halstedii]|eukprot:XP_024580687.1 elicitin-like protein [Plasmopara halstedii]